MYWQMRLGTTLDTTQQPAMACAPESFAAGRTIGAGVTTSTAPPGLAGAEESDRGGLVGAGLKEGTVVGAVEGGPLVPLFLAAVGGADAPWVPSGKAGKGTTGNGVLEMFDRRLFRASRLSCWDCALLAESANNSSSSPAAGKNARRAIAPLEVDAQQMKRSSRAEASGREGRKLVRPRLR